MYAINAVDDGGVDIDLYPYRQLWAAVMMQAVDDIAGRDRSKRHAKYAGQAAWWIETEGSGFEDVCIFLGIDPEIARGRILKNGNS